MKQKILK